MMYSWATPSYLLDEMSLDQWRLYYQFGWEVRQTEAQVHWGVLGQLLNGDDKKPKGNEEFKKAHPDGQMKDGAWVVSR